MSGGMLSVSGSDISDVGMGDSALLLTKNRFLESQKLELECSLEEAQLELSEGRAQWDLERERLLGALESAGAEAGAAHADLRERFAALTAENERLRAAAARGQEAQGALARENEGLRRELAARGAAPRAPAGGAGQDGRQIPEGAAAPGGAGGAGAPGRRGAGGPGAGPPPIGPAAAGAHRIEKRDAEWEALTRRLRAAEAEAADLRAAAAAAGANADADAGALLAENAELRREVQSFAHSEDDVMLMSQEIQRLQSLLRRRTAAARAAPAAPAAFASAEEEVAYLRERVDALADEAERLRDVAETSFEDAEAAVAETKRSLATQSKLEGALHDALEKLEGERSRSGSRAWAPSEGAESLDGSVPAIEADGDAYESLLDETMRSLEGELSLSRQSVQEGREILRRSRRNLAGKEAPSPLRAALEDRPELEALRRALSAEADVGMRVVAAVKKLRQDLLAALRPGEPRPASGSSSEDPAKAAYRYADELRGLDPKTAEDVARARLTEVKLLCEEVKEAVEDHLQRHRGAEELRSYCEHLEAMLAAP